MLNFLKEEGVFWEYEQGSKIHAKLTNGLHSDIYFNFSNLNIYSKFKYFLQHVGLLDSLKKHINNIDCICGQAYGSIFFANILGSLFDKPVIFTEKRSDGSMGLERYNSLKYNSILVVEDVITTGTTTLKTIECLSPATVYSTIISLVSYNNLKTLIYGKNLYQIESGLNIGVNFHQEENCILCGYGSKPIRPKDNWELFTKEI